MRLATRANEELRQFEDTATLDRPRKTDELPGFFVLGHPPFRRVVREVAIDRL